MERAHYHRQLVTKLVNLRAEHSAALRYDQCMFSGQSIVEDSIILTVFTFPLHSVPRYFVIILVNILFSASQSEIVGKDRLLRTIKPPPWINDKCKSDRKNTGKTREKILKMQGSQLGKPTLSL